MTTDPHKAREWLEDWTDVTGVEGLVVKAMNQRDRPRARDRAWTKIRRRDTTEAIIGAITRPTLLILGRHDPTRHLRPIGRTVPLRPDAARQLAEHLTPAGAGHPPGPTRSSRRHGAPTTSSTPPSSSPASSQRSAPTPPSTGAAYTGTRSGTCASARTRPSMTCPGSAGARPQLGSRLTWPIPGATGRRRRSSMGRPGRRRGTSGVRRGLCEPSVPHRLRAGGRGGLGRAGQGRGPAGRYRSHMRAPRA